jgi:hypothetical protein
MAKAEETAGKIGSKFPTGGGPAAQAITNEGLTVTVPTPKATLDELATNPMEARNAEFPTKFHKRSVSEVAKLRAEFENGIQKNFVREYAKTAEAKQLFQNEQLRKMQMFGELPKGYVVHHKLPLFRGGTNDFSNLQIITRAEHTALNRQLHWYEEGANPYGLD